MRQPSKSGRLGDWRGAHLSEHDHGDHLPRGVLHTKEVHQVVEQHALQASRSVRHLPGRGKEALSGQSRAGSSPWGSQHSGHQQAAALSLSSGDPLAISPTGAGAVGRAVPAEQGEGALAWPRCALPRGGVGHGAGCPSHPAPRWPAPSTQSPCCRATFLWTALLTCTRRDAQLPPGPLAWLRVASRDERTGMEHLMGVS